SLFVTAFQFSQHLFNVSASFPYFHHNHFSCWRLADNCMRQKARDTRLNTRQMQSRAPATEPYGPSVRKTFPSHKLYTTCSDSGRSSSRCCSAERATTRPRALAHATRSRQSLVLGRASRVLTLSSSSCAARAALASDVHEAVFGMADFQYAKSENDKRCWPARIQSSAPPILEALSSFSRQSRLRFIAYWKAAMRISIVEKRSRFDI
ncbi:hypothetical protein V8E36_004260, partial [Tilletia maclaganii]